MINQRTADQADSRKQYRWADRGVEFASGDGTDCEWYTDGFGVLSSPYLQIDKPR